MKYACVLAVVLCTRSRYAGLGSSPGSQTPQQFVDTESNAPTFLASSGQASPVQMLELLFQCVQPSAQAVGDTLIIRGHNLVDLLNNAIAQAYTLSESGLGYTPEQAQQEALSKIAQQLAQNWTRSFLQQTARLQGHVVVRNLQRPGTRYTIEGILKNTAGVIEVNNLSDGERFTTSVLTLGIVHNAADDDVWLKADTRVRATMNRYGTYRGPIGTLLLREQPPCKLYVIHLF